MKKNTVEESNKLPAEKVFDDCFIASPFYYETKQQPTKRREKVD